ncbi:dihydrodipicolinate synthase family protein [Propylenella binzhouense]|uniref:Dihydrodipicolinate synthase family protein n=1 Tax=Propylenella binzhouense TaxID=2555902 RepID=A0A964T6N9_9HYPH|nr:dihydrodipicolinate synthase family protein [Propylenella binzhouense]MYZ49410.1 dihydrodipicolinate synthase family protein [Propylenella binzhouense]
MTMPLAGIYAPVVTPFRPDLTPDPERFMRHCRWLVSQNCRLAVFGTNSEANSLSVGERKALLEGLVEGGVPAGRMMPGTGCCSIPETVDLTCHAVDLGVAAVLMLPPFYYKGVSEDGLFRHYSEVVQQVGDERLRICLYHIPQVSGVPIPLGLIERLIKAYPDSVVGIKDSSGDWANLAAMLDAFPGFQIFPASEGLLSRSLPLGAAGCISATANVNPAGIHRLWADWQSEAGPGLQADADRIRTIFARFPMMIAAMKAVVAHYACDPDWRIVRPPLDQLPADQTEALIGELDRAGFAMPGLVAEPA